MQWISQFPTLLAPNVAKWNPLGATNLTSPPPLPPCCHVLPLFVTTPILSVHAPTLPISSIAYSSSSNVNYYSTSESPPFILDWAPYSQ